MSATTETATTIIVPDQVRPAENVRKEPLKLSGALDQYKFFEVTPVIGQEYVEGNLKDWLRAPNSDELIRDLAITSTNLVFFLFSDAVLILDD